MELEEQFSVTLDEAHTQEFFTRLLERNFVDRIDPARGKLRSFLIAAVRNFLANHRAAAGRIKRGGHVVTVSLNWADGESRYAAEARTEDERRWHMRSAVDAEAAAVWMD